MVRVYFLKLPFGVATVTFQRPSVPAMAVIVSLLQDGVTLTVAPGAAVPHTGAWVFC